MEDKRDGKLSAEGGQSFWHRFRPGDPASNSAEQRGGGWVGGGGRRVWLRMTRAFGRLNTRRSPEDADAQRQPGALDKQCGDPESSKDWSRDGFQVTPGEVLKSRTLPLIHSAVNDDQQRYSPSPGTARRAPCTPPPAARRPAKPPTPPPSTRRAWESLRGRPGEVPPSPRAAAVAAASISSTDSQQPAGVTADLLPEAEYLYRRFVDESTADEVTTTEADDIDEGSIHDILDGYHSEDNVDDD